MDNFDAPTRSALELVLARIVDQIRDLNLRCVP